MSRGLKPVFGGRVEPRMEWTAGGEESVSELEQGREKQRTSLLLSSQSESKSVVRSAVRNIKTRGELECTQSWWTSQYRDSGNIEHRS
jgi:hypothetical protein